MPFANDRDESLSEENLYLAKSLQLNLSLLIINFRRVFFGAIISRFISEKHWK